MQRSHLQLIDLMIDDIRYAGAPPRSIEPLLALRGEHAQLPPAWFNTSEHFRDAVKRALDVQHAAFDAMASGHVWTEMEQSGESNGALWRRMRSTAALCARTGEHESALSLLRMSLDRQPLSAEQQAAVRAALQAYADEHGEASSPEVAASRLSRGSRSSRGASISTAAWMRVSNAVATAMTMANGPTRQRTLEVAMLLLADGLQPPWPATLVQLAGSCELEGLVSLLRSQLVVATCDVPTHVGRVVLVHSADERRNKRKNTAFATVDSGHWNVARLEAVEPSGLRVRGELCRPSHVLYPGTGGAGELLREAAAAGNDALVTALLVEAKVSPFESDWHATTALYHASARGHASTSAILLRHGLDPMLANAYRRSAYGAALANRHTAVRRVFVKPSSDTDVTQRASTGTALLAAAHDGDVEALRAELSGADVALRVNASVENEVTPLMVAARRGHTTCVTLLLKHGADTALLSRKGISALSMAAEDAHIDTCRTLLQAGAKVDQRVTKKAKTALWYAASSGNMDVVQLFVQYEADVDLRDSDGVNPLMRSARNGHIEVAVELINARACVNLCDNDRLSPLAYACTTGRLAVARELCERGAELNVADQHGASPLLLACSLGHEPLARLLLTYGASIDQADHSGTTPLLAAAEGGHTDTCRALLQAKASVDATDEGGASAIFLAAGGGHVDEIRSLVGAGAHVNQQDLLGMSPLMCAARDGREGAVFALLQANADPTLRARFEEDQANQVTVDALALAQRHGHEAVCALLTM